MKLKQSGTLAPAGQPWQLIRDAVVDLEKQEKCKQVIIDMGAWHEGGIEFDGRKVCYQCFAGSTISRRCDVDLTAGFSPEDFGPEVCAKLHALNLFRVGEIKRAYKELRIPFTPSLPEDVVVVDYHENKEKFKDQMRKLADLLECTHKSDKILEELQ